ncbi:MAG: hypothetical protein ACQEUY_07760 [Pseudomonadota bacterium]
MDKMGWQIFLGLKIAFLVLGIVQAALPPWSMEGAVHGFLRMTSMGFWVVAFFVLFPAVVSLCRNLWIVFRNSGGWVHMYQPGPEHWLVFVYTITFPLMLFVGVWIIYPMYFFALVLLLFIVGGYMGAEIRQRKDKGY